MPSDPDGLWRTFRRLHRDYSSFINALMGVADEGDRHLCRGRYGVIAIDEVPLCAAFRYVALKPERQQDCKWSSTRSQLAGGSNKFARVEPALERVDDFAAFLSEPFDEAVTYAPLCKAEGMGRTVGSPDWLADMEPRIGITLAPKRRSRAPRSAHSA